MASKDAKNALRAQLLAAILNLKNGGDPEATEVDIRPIINAAVDFLANHPDPVTNKHPDRGEVLALKDALDAFNNSGEDNSDESGDSGSQGKGKGKK